MNQASAPQIRKICLESSINLNDRSVRPAPSHHVRPGRRTNRAPRHAAVRATPTWPAQRRPWALAAMAAPGARRERFRDVLEREIDIDGPAQKGDGAGGYGGPRRPTPAASACRPPPTAVARRIRSCFPIRYRVSRRRTRRAAATPGRPRPSRKKTCVAGVLGQIFHGKAHRPVVIDHADEGVAGTASIAARRAHIAARFMAAVPHRSPGAFEPVTRRARRSDGGSEAS